MAKVKQEKKPREKQYKFYGFNIKVQTPSGNTASPKYYLNLTCCAIKNS